MDDEKVVREHLCGLIKKQKPKSRIYSYATGEEMLTSERRFDIIFLDIRMEKRKRGNEEISDKKMIKELSKGEDSDGEGLL